MKAIRTHAWLVLLASILLAGLIAMVGGESARADVRVLSPASSGSVQVPPAHGEAGPSEVIFPPRTVPLRFDHAQHDKLGAKCIDCHTNAKTSRRASERVVLSTAACDRCHGTDHGDLSVVKAGEGRRGRAPHATRGTGPKTATG